MIPQKPILSDSQCNAHSQCITKSLDFANLVAKKAGKKLTKQRLEVLQILLNDHKAMGAYDILENMRKNIVEGSNIPQPPTVYRALDYLLELGLVHKVESQNSFYACMIERKDTEQHIAQAFICETCGHVEEKAAISGAKNLFEKADGFGFKIEKVVMECRGICNACQKR